MTAAGETAGERPAGQEVAGQEVAGQEVATSCGSHAPVPGTTVITDPADPRLTEYTGLTDVALRSRREPAEGLFMAEGEKVIRRALDAGYPLRSLLLTPKWARLADVAHAAAPGAPVYLVAPEVAERVTGYHVHRGALAAMGRRPLPRLGALLDEAERATPATAGAAPARERSGVRIAVFEDLVDHANVGAAFRSAAALGVAAVLLSPRCADPLYRRAVKVSMGAVLAVPWTRLTDWPDELHLLRARGYLTAALAPGGSATDLADLAARRPPKLALLLGTEGDGLSAPVLRGADERVTIPMAASVDSLNVAAASAVAFYATRL